MIRSAFGVLDSGKAVAEFRILVLLGKTARLDELVKNDALPWPWPASVQQSSSQARIRDDAIEAAPNMHDGRCRRMKQEPCCVGKEDRATGPAPEVEHGPRGSRAVGFPRYLAFNPEDHALSGEADRLRSVAPGQIGEYFPVSA